MRYLGDIPAEITDHEGDENMNINSGGRLEKIESITHEMKTQCCYYGEPNGCNHPEGSLGCCDNLDEIAEELIDYRTLGTVEEFRQLKQAQEAREQSRRRAMGVFAG